MEAFFDSVPDAMKLRGLDGAVFHDTAILPDFASEHGLDVAAAWAAVLACPVHPTDKPLAFNFDQPTWVAGESKELNYRGKAVKRDKMWFQRNMAAMKRYGYTGWQWAVSAGTYRLQALPALDALVTGINKALKLKHEHNHWIVTRYDTGKDNIGLHSDKTKDWEEGSAFCVLKFGATRPFVFTQTNSEGKDVEIFSQELPAGAAIIVGMEANKKVKHAVPAVDEEVGSSGSIVGRCIATNIAWDTVQKTIAKERKRME